MTQLNVKQRQTPLNKLAAKIRICMAVLQLEPWIMETNT